MAPGPPIRVLIVDDHEVVRSGVRMTLESAANVEVIGEAEDADEALAAIQRQVPDVIFMDLSLRGMGGIELTRRIKSSHPEIQVIVLTLHEDHAYFLQALQAGASGYVVKGSPSSDLVRALEAVGEGGTFLSPNLATGLVSTYLEDTREGAFHGLTTREREVAELLIEGSSNQEIALALSISATTVQTHRAHIFEKLELRNHADLVRHAIRHGLIEP